MDVYAVVPYIECVYVDVCIDICSVGQTGPDRFDSWLKRFAGNLCMQDCSVQEKSEHECLNILCLFAHTCRQFKCFCVVSRLSRRFTAWGPAIVTIMVPDMTEMESARKS